MLTATYVTQYIHIGGFVIPTKEGNAQFLIALDSYSDTIIKNDVLDRLLYLQLLVEFTQKVLNMPVINDLSKVTIVTSLLPEQEAGYRNAVNRPVNYISNMELNEARMESVYQFFSERFSKG